MIAIAALALVSLFPVGEVAPDAPQGDGGSRWRAASEGPLCAEAPTMPDPPAGATFTTAFATAGLSSNGEWTAGTLRECRPGVADDVLRTCVWGPDGPIILPGPAFTPVAVSRNAERTAGFAYSDIGVGSAYAWQFGRGTMLLPPAGPGNTLAYDVAALAPVVVGTSASEAVLWTLPSARSDEPPVLTTLGKPSGATSAWSVSVSQDGACVVGNAFMTGGARMWRWRSAEGFALLPVPPQASSAWVIDASADCGTLLLNDNLGQVWLFSTTRGFSLVAPPGAGLTQLRLSGNGRVVGGVIIAPNGARAAVVWHATFGLTLVATINPSYPEGSNVNVTGLSDDGSRISILEPGGSLVLCLPSLGPFCDSIDFNNDDSRFDPQDLIDFLSVYSEGVCSTGQCNDTDFNNDNSWGPEDIQSFLSVYGEGPCL